MNKQVFNLAESKLAELFENLTVIINSFLIKNVSPCILLSGELGAGKTTLVREWLKFAGSEDLANSPTFSLENVYTWNQHNIHHFDLYRIKEKSEIEQTGFEEIWGYEGISFIEWWEIANDLIPKSGRIYLEIQMLNFEQRTYTLRYE